MTCLNALKGKFELVKKAQQAYEDNLKEVNIDPVFKKKFTDLRDEFKRMEVLVALLADLLDVEVPQFVIKEVKESSQMVLKKNQQEISQFEQFEDEF